MKFYWTLWMKLGKVQPLKKSLVFFDYVFKNLSNITTALSWMFRCCFSRGKGKALLDWGRTVETGQRKLFVRGGMPLIPPIWENKLQSFEEIAPHWLSTYCGIWFKESVYFMKYVLVPPEFHPLGDLFGIQHVWPVFICYMSCAPVLN